MKVALLIWYMYLLMRINGVPVSNNDFMGHLFHRRNYTNVLNLANPFLGAHFKKSFKSRGDFEDKFDSTAAGIHSKNVYELLPVSSSADREVLSLEGDRRESFASNVQSEENMANSAVSGKSSEDKVEDEILDENTPRLEKKELHLSDRKHKLKNVKGSNVNPDKENMEKIGKEIGDLIKQTRTEFLKHEQTQAEDSVKYKDSELKSNVQEESNKVPLKQAQHETENENVKEEKNVEDQDDALIENQDKESELREKDEKQVGVSESEHESNAPTHTGSKKQRSSTEHIVSPEPLEVVEEDYTGESFQPLSSRADKENKSPFKMNSFHALFRKYMDEDKSRFN